MGGLVTGRFYEYTRTDGGEAPVYVIASEKVNESLHFENDDTYLIQNDKYMLNGLYKIQLVEGIFREIKYTYGLRKKYVPITEPAPVNNGGRIGKRKSGRKSRKNRRKSRRQRRR